MAQKWKQRIAEKYFAKNSPAYKNAIEMLDLAEKKLRKPKKKLKKVM